MAYRYAATFFREAPDQPRGLVMWAREGSEGLYMLFWDHVERTWKESVDVVLPLLYDGTVEKVVEISRKDAIRLAAELGFSPVPTEAEATALCRKEDTESS